MEVGARNRRGYRCLKTVESHADKKYGFALGAEMTDLCCISNLVIAWFTSTH